MPRKISQNIWLAHYILLGRFGWLGYKMIPPTPFTGSFII